MSIMNFLDDEYARVNRPEWENVHFGPFDPEHYRIVKGCEYIMFDSLYDFDKHAEPMWLYKNKAAADQVFSPGWSNYTSDWLGSGGRSTQQTMELIRTGWPEMLHRLQAMWGSVRPELEVATSMIQVRRRKRHRSDHGDTLDIHRVWSGELDRAWERPVREVRMQSTERHVSIYINLAANAGHDAGSLLWRSTAALLICELLAKTGRQVEIYVGDSSIGVGVNGPTHSVNSLLIKKYDEPVNLEKLAATANPAFYRTYGFLMCTCIPFDTRGQYGGAWSGGMPLPMIEQAARGQLTVDIRGCTSRDEAIVEFYRVRDALMKQDDAARQESVRA